MLDTRESLHKITHMNTLSRHKSVLYEMKRTENNCFQLNYDALWLKLEKYVAGICLRAHKRVSLVILLSNSSYDLIIFIHVV